MARIDLILVAKFDCDKYTPPSNAKPDSSNLGARVGMAFSKRSTSPAEMCYFNGHHWTTYLYQELMFTFDKTQLWVTERAIRLLGTIFI